MRKIVAFLFSLIGIFLIVWGYSELNKAKQSESWPSVEGKIQKSEIIEKKRTGKKRRKTSYQPNIIYSYQVDSATFTNNKISYSGYRSDRSGAKTVIDTYPEGKTVLVYYDPSNPQESVLEKGVGYITYLPIAFGVILILVFIFILFKK